MEVLALVVAIVALLVALSNKRGGGSSNDLNDLRSDARRRVENLADELRVELDAQRKLLADVASGVKLDRSQILEGRLWSDVDPREGASLVKDGRVELLDVRTPQETSGGVIPGAVLIPIDQLEERLDEVPDGGKPLLVYCAAGGRSAAACELLSQRGRVGVKNLSGGMGSWSGPVAKP